LVALTSVFEPEETEKRGIDEGNDDDQGIDLHALTCGRYIGCDEDEGKECTSQGTI
jgi:hypothetical protein